MVVSAKKNHFQHTPTYSLPLGLVLIAFSATITVLAYLRYRHIQKRISNSEFVQSSTLTKLTALLLLASCILLIVYLWLTT